MILYLSKIIL